jgi:hypothetical protein
VVIQATNGSDELRGVVAIGASAGGVEALSSLAAGLSPELPYACLMALHIPAGAPSILARIIDRKGPLPGRRRRRWCEPAAGPHLPRTPEPPSAGCRSSGGAVTRAAGTGRRSTRNSVRWHWLSGPARSGWCYRACSTMACSGSSSTHPTRCPPTITPTLRTTLTTAQSNIVGACARSVLPVLVLRKGDVDAQQHRGMQRDEGARKGERKRGRREIPPPGHGHQTGQAGRPRAHVDNENGRSPCRPQPVGSTRSARSRTPRSAEVAPPGWSPRGRASRHSRRAAMRPIPLPPWAGRKRRTRPM